MLFCFFGLAGLAALARMLAAALDGLVPFLDRLTVAAFLWAVCAAVPGYAVFAAGAGRLKRLDWDL